MGEAKGWAGKLGKFALFLAIVAVAAVYLIPGLVVKLLATAQARATANQGLA
jgi:hypothetical protein